MKRFVQQRSRSKGRLLPTAEKAISAAEAIAASGDDPTTKAELEQAITDMKEQRKYVGGLGIPVGFDYFPHACLFAADGSETVAMQSGGVEVCGVALAKPVNLIIWLMGIALTALLAGLGAPFWFDTVSSISQLTQRMRGATAQPTRS